MIETIALLACVILFGLSLFQAALVLGAPVGKYAWGGNYKVLPISFRIGSFFSIILYLLFAFIILTKVGILQASIDENLISTVMWVLSGYFVIGVLMNAVSRSRSEKLVMTPVAFILAALFLTVSLN